MMTTTARLKPELQDKSLHKIEIHYRRIETASGNQHGRENQDQTSKTQSGPEHHSRNNESRSHNEVNTEEMACRWSEHRH
jgi:hypothetical protein